MAICDANRFASTGTSTGLEQGTDKLSHIPLNPGRVKCVSLPETGKLVQGQAAKLKLTVRDYAGQAVDLSSLVDSYASSSPEPEPYIWFTGLETEKAPVAIFNVPCEIVDASAGEVTCELSPDDTARPGLFLCQLGVFDLETSGLLQSTKYYLSVEWSAFSDNYSRQTGCLTFSEVRLAMRDACAQGNFLLDDLEYDDAEVSVCIRRAVDEFNETYVPGTNYTPSTFPWRHSWLNAVCAYLLRMAAVRYARNQLEYSAGGVSVNDQNKAQPYLMLSDLMLKEWREFILRKKLELNMKRGWGSQLSSYSYQRYR
jgi:hypothetical protein